MEETAAARARAKQILQEARREAKRIVAEAKESLGGGAEKGASGRAPVTQAAIYDTVEIELYRDSGRYAEPLPVKWGGRQFVIPRGVRVSVPAPVAEIIRISDAQEIKTADLIRRLESR